MCNVLMVSNFQAFLGTDSFSLALFWQSDVQLFREGGD